MINHYCLLDASGIATNAPQLCLVADYEATQYQFNINFNTSKNE